MIDRKPLQFKIDTIRVVDESGTILSNVRPSQERFVFGYPTRTKERQIVFDIDMKNAKDCDWCLEFITEPNRCRLVNHSQKPLTIKQGSNGDHSELYDQVEITIDYEETFTINESYTLIFQRQRKSKSYELKLNLDNTTNQLTKDHTKFLPLTGEIELQLKENPPESVEFTLELEIGGMSREAYSLDVRQVKIDTKGEKAAKQKVQFFVFHPSGKPLSAGDYPVMVKARSSAYNAELATDTNQITVLPFYAQEIEISNPMRCHPAETAR